jgi:tetratricopeptide (TPR) repeat protein
MTGARVLQTLLALAPLTAGPAPWSATQATDYDVALRTAVNDLNAGRLLESVRRLSQLVNDAPALEAPYFYLSTIYTGTGDYELAERHIRSALDLREDGAFLYQLGVIEHRRGDRRAALRTLDRAIARGPGQNTGAALRQIGEIRIELLEWNLAESAYRMALAAEPEDARTLLRFGQLHLDRNDPEQAVAALVRALDIEPRLIDAYHALGLAYRRLGDAASSIDIFRRGLEAAPSNQELRYGLGQSLVLAGRPDEGRRELEEYNRIRELLVQANTTFDTAGIRLREGRLDEAEELLEETLRLAPDYGPALSTMGVVLLEKGESRNAILPLERAVEVYPLDAESWFNLGTAYFETGGIAEALTATGNAILIDPLASRYRERIEALQSMTERRDRRDD